MGGTNPFPPYFSRMVVSDKKKARSLDPAFLYPFIFLSKDKIIFFCDMFNHATYRVIIGLPGKVGKPCQGRILNGTDYAGVRPVQSYPESVSKWPSMRPNSSVGGSVGRGYNGIVLKPRRAFQT